MISAFGVDHGEINKVVQQSSGGASTGRHLSAQLAMPVHGLVAGRKGRKLAAGGAELGSAVGGGAAGNLLGRGVGAGIGALTKKPGAARMGARVGSSLGATTGSIGALHASVNTMNRSGWYKPQKKS